LQGAAVLAHGFRTSDLVEAEARRRADLGPLKGTRGTHDYPVPSGASVDLKGGTTVLVYCHAFNVAFGNATLSSG
jgi:hypothetical protein